MKICSKCKQEKEIINFYNSKKTNDGLYSWCKDCCKQNDRRYRKTSKKYKIYCEKNKLKLSNYIKKYYQDNKESLRMKQKEYYLKNKDKILAHNREYRKNHPKNLEKGRLNQQRHYQQIKNNPKYKLNHNLSRLISASLKGNKNGLHWEDLVDYKLEDLIKHLEKQFKDGMTWDNYGKGNNKWNVDHKIPISIFNFSKHNHIDFKRCWALKNLQPMWEKENRIKQNIILTPFQPSLAL